jgi:hypothetical protein
MIGEYLVDLPNLASEANHEGSKGVLPNCQMKCDAMPCKNLGICTEDFGRQESSCNCELTSYFGEYCADGEQLILDSIVVVSKYISLLHEITKEVNSNSSNQHIRLKISQERERISEN